MTELSSPPQAPAPTPPRTRLPEIPGPVETLIRAWHRLRRMSTALWLLLALAVATVIATFVPQEPVIPSTVADWREGIAGPGKTTAAAFDALGLFDVFGSPWFMALTVLLVVSLTGCLIPRVRTFLRNVRRPPVPGRNLHRVSTRVELESPMAPERAAALAHALLRRRRFRARTVPAEASPTGNLQVAAERGHWREGGSIAFHLSFYLLLAGGVLGHLLGFTGQVNVVEGSSFADTRLSYIGGANPGRLFSMDQHRGFVVRLDDFDVSYFEPEGTDEAGREQRTPREFVSRVTILEGGQERAQEEIRVNEPISYDGMKLYQVRFGFAPRIEVSTANGTPLYSEAVQLLDAGGAVWTGVAKVASFDVESQIALELVLLPDAAFGPDGVPLSRSPEPRNPRLAVVLWYGELGLERNVPATEFDRENGRRLEQPLILSPGETGTFEPLGLTVSFPELPYWSGFQVSHERGRWLLLAGSILLLGGLIPSLYAYRRRLWVDVQPVGEGCRVVLAGVALQRKPLFAEAFDEIASELRTQLTEPMRQEP